MWPPILTSKNAPKFSRNCWALFFLLRAPNLGSAEGGLFRFVPIAPFSSDLFQFVLLVSGKPDLFWFVPICSDFFPLVFRANQGNPFLPSPCGSPRFVQAQKVPNKIPALNCPQIGRTFSSTSFSVHAGQWRPDSHLQNAGLLSSSRRMVQAEILCPPF